METIGLDCIKLIFSYSDEKDLIKWLTVSKTINNIINNLSTTNDIYSACENGRYLSISKLKNNFYNINRALIYACKSGKIDIVKFFIFKGGNKLNECLAEACRYGHLELANYLIKIGAKDLDTALSKAGHSGNLELIKFLIYNGATNFKFALSNACYKGHLNIINFLIGTVENLSLALRNACKSKNRNIVNFIFEQNKIYDINYGLYGACYSGDIKLVNLVIKKGATDWNYGAVGACRGGKIETLKIMINNGANEYDKFFNSACKNGSIEIITFLLRFSPNFNIALFYATKYGKYNIVEYLIDKYTDDNFYIIVNSAFFGHKDILEFLLKFEVTINELNIALKYACSNGRSEIVKYLLEIGANNYENAFYMSCVKGHIELVKLFLDKVNIKVSYACINGNLKIIELLINYGADDLNEGLINACKYGHLDVVKFLIYRGAKNLNKAFKVACKNDHSEIVNYLFNYVNNINQGLKTAKNAKNYKIIDVIMNNLYK